MQNQESSFAAIKDLLTGETFSSPGSRFRAAFSGLTPFIDSGKSDEPSPVSSISVNSTAATSDGDFAVTSAAAKAGDVLVANAMPEAEYMYGCTPTALAMLLGYYDLYGNDDLGYANLIEGDVDLDSRGSDGNIYNMNEFDSVLGRFIASPEYVAHFFGTETAETTPEQELPYTFVNGGSSSGVSEINVSLWNCLSDYLGTSQYWRGNENYGTLLYYSTRPGVNLTLAAILAESGTKTITSGATSRTIDWHFSSMLYGLNLYVESRGYSLDEAVTGNYLVDTNGGTFTFEDYMAEIDAGRPVLIGITGHSMVGYGYNASTREIIFDDTYFSGQRMTWGGTYFYSGEYRELDMITLIRLEGGETAYPIGLVINTALTDAVATKLNVQVTATGSITADSAYTLQLTEEDHAVYLSGGSISGSYAGSGAGIMFGTDIGAVLSSLNNYKGTLIFNGSAVNLGFTVEGNGGATVAAAVAARILNVSFKGSAVGSSAIAITLSCGNKSLLYADAFRAALNLTFGGNFSGTIDVSTVYSNINLGAVTTRSSALYAGTGMTIEDTFAGTVSVSTRVDATNHGETVTAGGLCAGGNLTVSGKLNGNWTIGATGGMTSSTVRAYGVSAATVAIANMGAKMYVSASGTSAEAYGVYGGTSVAVTNYSGNLLVSATGAEGSGIARGVYSAGTLTGRFGGSIVANGLGDSCAIGAVGALNIAVTGTLFSGYYADASKLAALLADSFTNRRALTAAADGRYAITGGTGSTVTLTGNAAVFGGISLAGTGSSLTLSGNASVYGDIASAEDLNLTISLAGTSFNHCFITTDSTENFPSITVNVSDAAIGTYQLVNSPELTLRSISVSGGFGTRTLEAGTGFEWDGRIYSLTGSGETLRLNITKVPGGDPTPGPGPLVISDVPRIAVENGVAIFTWKAAEGTREALGYRLVVDGNYYFSAQTNYTLALAAGTYTVAVQALDDKGAWGAWTSSRILIVGDTENPLLSGLPYAGVSGSTVNLEWGAGTDNSGVEGYLLRIDGKVYKVYDTVYSLKCGAGVHTYSVRAFDAAGNLSSWSEEQTFEVADTTAPEFGSRPRVAIAGGTVTIRWNAASDDVAVTGYKIRINGVETDLGNVTSYSFDGEAGDYIYQVNAYDAAENNVWTAAETFSYSEEMGVADKTELLSGEIAEDVPGTKFAISVEAGLYLLQGSFGGLNAKIRIVDASGKTVYSASVRNGQLPDKGILLDGDYTIVVTGKTPGDFSLALLGDTFDRGNNADDNHRTMSAEDYWVAIGDSPTVLVADEWVGYGDAIDYRGLLFEYDGKYSFSFTATDAAKLTVWTMNADGSLKAVKSVSVKAGEQKGISGLLFDSGLYYLSVESTTAKKGGGADYSVTLTSDSVFFTKGDNSDDVPPGTGELILIGESTSNPIAEGWVGYGDAVDYKPAIFVNDGKYSFSFTATDAAKLTLWVTTGDGGLKMVKSVSVKGGQTKALSGLLLDGGIYYFSVESTNAKKGGNADYMLSLSEESVFFTNQNNADDNPLALAEEYQVTLAGGEATLISGDWVGYGDAVDYRAVTVGADGDYRFTLSGAADAVRLTLYSVDSDGRQKKVKSVALKSGAGSFEALGLDSGTNYLVAVESTTAKKGGGTFYSLDVACLNELAVEITGWESMAVNLDRYEQPSLAGYTADSATAVSAGLESSWFDETKKSLAQIA